MRNSSIRKVLLSLLSAVLISTTFLIQQSWILTLFSLVPLLLSIKDSSSVNAFSLGTLTGATAYFITTYWLVDTITVFGGFPIIISVFFHIVISIYSGLIFGIFSYLVIKLRFQVKSLIHTVLLGIIWVAAEYYYPLLFPFSIASPLANYYPIIQASDLVGINFYSFLLILFNFTFFNIINAARSGGMQNFKEILMVSGLTIIVIIYGFHRISIVDKQIEDASKIKVGIVQGNFDFTEKKMNNYLVMVNEYKKLSTLLDSKPQLIIWPETAVQVFISTDSNFLKLDDSLLIPENTKSYFLTGGLSYEIINKNMPLNEENINYYNSAFLTDYNGKILGRFHKIKLLLFGEYLPFSDYFPSIKKLSPATGDYIPGNELNLLEIDNYNIKLATLICYEDIIPSFARRFKQKGANLLVNLTNDAWFGKTIAPYQHLLIALPRSVENRSYFIRATNTGVSAIIDPVGRILRQTDLFEQETIESSVGLMNDNKTFYTLYGYRIYQLCLAISVVYLFFNLVLGRKYG